MENLNKVKKVGDKITFNYGGFKGTKEYTIKRVVVQADLNRYKYWVSKEKFISSPMNKQINNITTKTYSRLIGF